MWGLLKQYRRLALAISICVAAPWCPGAERWATLSDPVFLHLAHDGELPSSAVPTAVAQDGEGFLWIGSQNGLARWDGYHFRIYHSHRGEAGALPENFIQTLHVDARGALWVGTTSAGLARFDREHDRFVVYPVGPEGLSNVSARAIVDDGEGGVWVATEGGLDHLLAGAAGVEHLRHVEGDPGSLPGNRIQGALRDRHGTLWIGTATALVRLEPGSKHFTTVPLPAADGRVASPWTFLEDSAGRIWIGTVRQGAYVLDAGGGSARPVEETGSGNVALRNEGVDALIEASPGRIWLGTLGGGIVEVDSNTGQTRRIRHDPMLPDSLADDSVQALFKDHAGLIWVCTTRSVSQYDPAQSAMVTVFGASSRPKGVSDSNVDSILPQRDGRIWLGLDNKGIDVLDPVDERVASLRPDPAHPATALPDDYVNAFAPEADGSVFVGTEQGLYHVDRDAHAATRIEIPGRDAAAQVWVLHLSAGTLWVGGFDGLWSLDVTGRSAGPRKGAWPEHAIALEQLSDQRVTVIAPGNDEVLWVGTKNGLNRIDPNSQQIERILPAPADPTALAAGYVTSVLTDSRGRVWVATFGGGINILEGRRADGRPRFRRLGLAQGLSNENANKLLEDSRHNMWVSSDDGLAVIDEETFAIRTFHRAEGLPISNYWVGAGAVTAQGELLFGGVGGLTVVRPERLTAWSYQPPVVITDLRIGGKPVVLGRLNHGGAADPLLVSARANSLAAEFAALDYSAPLRNRYAYRLDGFDASWVETDAAHRLAAYTNLPPGEYTLRLRGSNRDGVWSERTLNVPIHVLPSWYQTLAFRVGATVTALLLIALLVQGRTVYLRRNQRQLEHQVIERTRELRESQRQLEQIAYYDTLTALPNRRMFSEEIRELLVLARMQQQMFALLLIDLDRFKRVNDSLGHDAGDALLVEASLRLQAAVRKSDCVARIGGDEFAVLVANNPAATDIESICQRIIESFKRPVPIGTSSVMSSASIGVAVFGHHGTTLDALYKSADLALYEAKRDGGDLYRWYRTVGAAGSHGAAGSPGVSDDVTGMRKKSQQPDQDEI